VFKAVSVSTAGTALFVIVESICRNIVHLDIDELIPHTSTHRYVAETFSGYIRARGWASEPAHTAIFFNMALLMVGFYLDSRSKWIQALYYAIGLCALTLLFSTMGFIAMFCSILLYLATRISSRSKQTLTYVVTCLAVATIVVAFANQYVMDFVKNTMIVKAENLLVGGQMSTSDVGRREAYRIVVEIAQKYPFGIGFGITSAAANAGALYEGIAVIPGQISLFGYLLVAGGFPALLLFLGFYYSKLRKASKLPGLSARLLAIGFGLFLHYLFVTDQELPFLWFYLAVVDSLYRVRQNVPAFIAHGNVPFRRTALAGIWQQTEPDVSG
jgi:hypothetical protein